MCGRKNTYTGMQLKKISILLMVIGIGTGVGGFFCPPIGQIDNSVLIFVGECIGAAGLVAAIMAIERGIDAKFQHKDTSLTLTNPDTPQK